MEEKYVKMVLNARIDPKVTLEQLFRISESATQEGKKENAKENAESKKK